MYSSNQIKLCYDNNSVGCISTRRHSFWLQMALYVTGVIRQSEPFGTDDTYNHLYLFLRSFQRSLQDFSSVQLQFIYCPCKLGKTSDDLET